MYIQTGFQAIGSSLARTESPTAIALEDANPTLDQTVSSSHEQAVAARDVGGSGLPSAVVADIETGCLSPEQLRRESSPTPRDV